MNPVSPSRSRKLHLIDLQFDHSERVVKAVPTLTVDSLRALRQETPAGQLPSFQVLRALCFLA
jgi:hypothetical protein